MGVINLDYIKSNLRLSPQVMTEIETNCEGFNFDIFKVRDLTGGNELVTVLLYLLTR